MPATLNANPTLVGKEAMGGVTPVTVMRSARSRGTVTGATGSWPLTATVPGRRLPVRLGDPSPTKAKATVSTATAKAMASGTVGGGGLATASCTGMSSTRSLSGSTGTYRTAVAATVG